ncbi:MAG: phosphatidylinositol-3-phosphatase [Ktedonobacteraceae bacterium]
MTPSVTPGMTPSPSVTAGTTPTVTPSTTPTPSLPRFDHIVVVIEENKGYSEIIGANSPAPYINSLAGQGMLFTNAHAITHPSEPNYLDLFSGSDQGVVGDACDSSVYAPPDLGGQLIGAKLSFAGYSEGLPAAGDTRCSDSATSYARKHAPWANFSDTNGPTTNLPYTSFPTPAAGYSSLPTVSFVVPNLNNDMHDGTIQQGDIWLQQNMDAYAQWAKTNNSLLIVTWDENDTSQLDPSNQVATIFVGQHVQTGTNATSINHYSVLRTLEDMYGLSPANNAASASDILGVWN